MKFNRGALASALFLLVAIVVAVWLYPKMPDRIPVHWDVHGNFDGSMSRFWASAFPALTIAGLMALTGLLPWMSPRRFEIDSFVRVFGIVMLAIQGSILVLGLAMLFNGAGYAMPMPMLAMLAAGAIFMVIGNYMGKLRRNFFIGIRTPWTLSSDAVWERTHRIGGWLFLLAGLVAMLSSLLHTPLWFPIASLLAAVLISCIYSWVIYRRLSGKA
ncbi:MAG TPA: SdpI family protein [Rhodanobacter sp.]